MTYFWGGISGCIFLLIFKNLNDLTIGNHMNSKYKMALHNLNTACETSKCFPVSTSCLQNSSSCLLSNLSIHVFKNLLSSYLLCQRPTHAVKNIEKITAIIFPA